MSIDGMIYQGRERAPEDKEVKQEQEAEKPVGIFAGIAQIFLQHKEWLREVVRKQQEELPPLVADAPVPLEEIEPVEKKAPTHDYQLVSTNLEVEPNPEAREFAARQHDLLQEKLGGLTPTDTPAKVARSQHTTVAHSRC